MEPNWTDVATAITALIAVVLAGLAWVTSVNALRTTYRPVIRPVPLRIEHGGGLVVGHRLILKNIGFGPAMAVMLFDAEQDDDPFATESIIEPLGDGPTEGQRRGRTEMILTGGPMQMDHDYRLLYQDVAGAWHETRFTYRSHDFLVRFLGPRRWYHALRRVRSIPRAARTHGVVVRAPETI